MVPQLDRDSPAIEVRETRRGIEIMNNKLLSSNGHITEQMWDDLWMSVRKINIF